MKIKNKILAYLATLLCIGTIVTPLQVSAYKANGKYYLGNYIPGDNVNTSLTLRSGSSFDSSTLEIIYKTDYPGTDSDSIRITKITSNLAGWTDSVRTRKNVKNFIFHLCQAAIVYDITACFFKEFI